MGEAFGLKQIETVWRRKRFGEGSSLVFFMFCLLEGLLSPL